MIQWNKKIIASALLTSIALQMSANPLSSFISNLFTPGSKTNMVGLALGAACAWHLKNNYGQSNSDGVRKQVDCFYASKEDGAHLITEPVEWPVKVVYHDNPLSKMLAWIGGYVGKYVTRYAGNVANSDDPAVVKAKIDHYQSFYKDMLNMDEFSVPVGGFKTFNEWFIREFKNIDTARPFDEDNALAPDSLSIASPADSKLLIIPNLSHDTHVMIKEKLFDIKKFLGDEQLAKRFEGGVMMIFRLAPYDYHRYHYPFNCFVGQEQYINGDYHSVNPRAFNVGCKPLTENLRSFQLLTPNLSAVQPGKQAVMVQVGATAVASIKNHFMDYETQRCKASEKVYMKGQETGYFQFGGSTIVLLFPANTIIPDLRIVGNSENGYETAVKVRETVARWIGGNERVAYSRTPLYLC